MKIAVASQNRKQITGHTGRCRRFWIYEIIDGKIADKALLELTMEQTFHASPPNDPHPLDGVQVLISGGMGQGMVTRLARKGIEGLVTTETDPDQAVTLYLAGSLPAGEIEPGGEHRQLRGERNAPGSEPS